MFSSLHHSRVFWKQEQGSFVPDEFYSRRCCPPKSRLIWLGFFLNTLHIPKATFIGSSWGGGYALYFTEKHPERVSTLVSLDGAGRSAGAGEPVAPAFFSFVGERANFQELMPIAGVAGQPGNFQS